MMDSFDIAFMVDELIERMIARGLSVDDMKNVAKVVNIRIEAMGYDELEASK
jgi:hypothetical protein